MSGKSEPNSPLARLADELGEELAAVDVLIRQRAESPHVARIQQIAEHLLDSGGKRIRPILTLAAARQFGHAGGNHILLAAAVEFIHTATLLHDDVVDESTQRRGRPTANRLWDNKAPVLVGDFFFARSFQLMVQTDSMEALDVLADASATISEAEVIQLAETHSVEVDEETYFRIIDGKTAALFAAAARVGTIVAGGTSEQVAAMGRYGNALGTSFQIRDDILDYGGSRMLGKNVGDDFKDRKMTLPLIRAYGEGTDEERRFWRRTIGRGNQQDGDLDRAIGILRRRGTLERVQEVAMFWSRQALNELEGMPENPILSALEDLAVFAVTRRA